MSINRSKLWLALGLQIALAAVVQGQELPDYEWVPGVRDFQPFAPASDITSPYGRGPNRRKRGWFFTIEDLAWSTSAPERTTVGKEGFNPIVSTGSPGGFIVQPNTLDTGFIQPHMQQGERLQLGYVGDDDIGWLVGTFVVHSQTSTATASNAGVSFAAPFVNGVSPLEGFLQEALPIPANQPPPFGTGGTGGGGGGAGGAGATAIVDADLNNNHVFGASGRDIGTPNASPPPLFTPPPDGFPDVAAPADFGDLVNLPIFFDHVYTRYSSRVWGIEVMRTYGLSKSRRADHGIWDFMAGVRYIRFNDSFYFLGEGFTESLTSGTGGGGGTGSSSAGGAVIQSGLLADTHFTQTSNNNLVGPQIGLRYQKQRGRLAFNTEWRFMAAGNAQNNLQTGQIGEHRESGTLRPVLFVQFPQASQAFLSQQGSTGGTGGAASTRAFTAPQFRSPNFVPQSVFHKQNIGTFSPVGEFRFNLKYQIFRQCYATVGWTGLVMGGIGRSPNMVDYSLPALGILNTNNRQVVFIQGINFGFTINR